MVSTNLRGLAALFVYASLKMADERTNDDVRTSKVYENDPLHFKSFVNNYVEVKTNLGSSYKGFVYTIDPVSER